MNKRKTFIDRNAVLLMTTLLAGAILAPINSTMISVSLPSIANYFDAEIIAVSWVVTSYLIVMAVAQPIAGKLGDLYGYRRIYLWGLCLFSIASVACAFSFHLLWLIVFRSLQALGGALTVPTAMAILRHVVPPERMGRTFGLFSMFIGVGVAIGPLLGSFLIGQWSWQSLFWVNLPFLFVALTGTMTVLPDLKNGQQAPLDIVGSIYFGISITLLVLLTNGLGSSWTILLISVLVGMFVVLFVRRERRFSEPLVDFALFRNRTFTIANVSILLSNMMMYSTLLVMPLLMVYRFQMPVGQVGWVLFAFSCSLSLFSALGGILSDKFGQRTIINFSFFVSVLAMLLYLGMFAIDSVVYLVLSLLVGGIGAGIGMTAMQVAVLQSVKKEMSGIGTGIFSTFRYIGGIIGSTLIGFLSQSPVLFVILFMFGVVGLTLSFGFPKQPRSDVEDQEGQSVSS